MNKVISSVLAASAMLVSAACSASTATQPLYVAPVIDQTTTAPTSTATDTTGGPSTTTTAATSDSSIPSDDSGNSHHFYIGPEASVFFPTSSKTGNTYGKSWTSIGIGLGTAYQASQHGTLSPFFTILYNTHAGNRAFLLPLGISYNKAISSNPTSFYYGGDIFVIGADQRALAYNVHSGFRYGEGIRPAIGYEFGRTAYVQAAYTVTSTIKGFDFSGTTLEAGFRF